MKATSKIVIAGELNLDNPAILLAVRALFTRYASKPAAEIPSAFVLMGNFISQAGLAGAPGSGSIEHKEIFNGLAAVFSDFPTVLARTTLVFVPGDQDAWPSAFSAGSAIPLPRKPVPEMFTTRIRRVVAEANREIWGRQKSSGVKEGEVVWTTNPSRLTWFDCVGEMVLFRDDFSGRLRRNAVRFSTPQGEEGQDDSEDVVMSGALSAADAMETDGEERREAEAESSDGGTSAEEQLDADTLIARRLAKTIVDQSHLAPFPLHIRPIHWDYVGVMSLYPLPTALVVADAEAPAFALNYMGCCVMNPGRLVRGQTRGASELDRVGHDIATRRSLK
ncbi:DNA polymerase alpha/epsilon, subunit B [Lepidopterella palustris CBS 459.81]|uniref:DNA polymerase epsilon subunit B n=1 Tax=Lepidopterella palustris CBS 459.81 TaxID=1314670 RepID=A0A8E2DYS2_9PEZI|nr:DNA polymerase alpha/epsilon, subunit B [Lepidopterella palustris CBS 459.81]